MNKRYTLEAAREAAGLASCRSSSPGRPATSSSRSPMPNASLREVGNARIVEIPDAKHLRSARPAAAPGRRDRGFRRQALSRPKSEQTFPEIRKVQLFRPTGQGIFLNPLPRRRDMPKQIFDQDRPRSTMAQQLDEAFAGCDQWTLAPPVQRRSSLDFKPRASSSSGSAAAPLPCAPRSRGRCSSRRRAVGGCPRPWPWRWPDARSRPGSPAGPSPAPTATTAPGASRGCVPPAGRRR